jgi:hypothetical protein
MSPQTPELDPIIRACRTSELPTLAELARHIWQQHYPAIISQAQIDYMLQQALSPCRPANRAGYTAALAGRPLAG